MNGQLGLTLERQKDVGFTHLMAMVSALSKCKNFYKNNNTRSGLVEIKHKKTHDVVFKAVKAPFDMYEIYMIPHLIEQTND